MSEEESKQQFLGALLIMEVILEAVDTDGIDRDTLYIVLLGAVTEESYDDLLQQAKNAKAIVEEDGHLTRGPEYKRGLENIRRLIQEGKR